jgi:hypothetical protein
MTGSHHPGYRRAFSAHHIIGMILPSIAGIAAGPNYLFKDGIKREFGLGPYVK